MFRQTIKIDKDLVERIRRCSKAAGYSSPEEFVRHILERELSRMEESDSDEEIVRKLQGLGYLD